MDTPYRCPRPYCRTVTFGPGLCSGCGSELEPEVPAPGATFRPGPFVILDRVERSGVTGTPFAVLHVARLPEGVPCVATDAVVLDEKMYESLRGLLGSLPRG